MNIRGCLRTCRFRTDAGAAACGGAAAPPVGSRAGRHEKCESARSVVLGEGHCFGKRTSSRQVSVAAAGAGTRVGDGSSAGDGGGDGGGDRGSDGGSDGGGDRGSGRTAPRGDVASSARASRRLSLRPQSGSPRAERAVLLFAGRDAGESPNGGQIPPRSPPSRKPPRSPRRVAPWRPTQPLTPALPTRPRL